MWKRGWGREDGEEERMGKERMGKRRGWGRGKDGEEERMGKRDVSHTHTHLHT